MRLDPLMWTEWAPLNAPGPFTPAVLAETLDGGQAFRWHRQPNETWLGFFGEQVVSLRLTSTGDLQWSAPETLAARTPAALVRYLDLKHDPRALADSLPWRSDATLAAAIDAFPGLRILRQPFGETLLGFLCSATKQIVQIKQMLKLLAANHGRELSPGAHALPDWPTLAGIPERELRACQLGFRARYISETARFLAAHPGWLTETEKLPYAAAKDRLCTLPGVGEKVADCVLLFGAGQLEAFPVDVWIIKTMARRYGLDGWKPAQIAHFGRTHFGPLAGLAQQYLFAYERQLARAARV